MKSILHFLSVFDAKEVTFIVHCEFYSIEKAQCPFLKVELNSLIHERINQFK